MAMTANAQFGKIEATVLQSLPISLFAEFKVHLLKTCHVINSHYLSLCCIIYKTYFTVRLHQMAELSNSTDRALIRQKLTHTILFMNQ